MAALLAAASIWAYGYPGPPDARPAPGDLGLLRHLAHYAAPWSRRRAQRAPVRIDARGLLPADVVLASLADSPYGYWSHVTALTGDDQVLGHNVLFGIFAMKLTALVSYDDVRVLRAPLRPDQRARVARFLNGLRGAVFQLGARKGDPYQWTCAKAVWAAYRAVGIDLAPGRSLVVPDDIAASPRLHLVREWRSP